MLLDACLWTVGGACARDEIRKYEVELFSEKLRPGNGELGGEDGPVHHCFISIFSYIICLFGSCDRDVLEKVSNKIVIKKLKITRQRIQILVKLEVSAVQLLNMSSVKVLLKRIERRYQNSLFRSIYFEKTPSVAIFLSFLITSVSYLTCTFSKLA